MGMERYRVILAGICALVLTVGIARFAYTPLLPIMQQQADLSPLAGGWLATANYMGYISGAVLAAMTSDLHRKFVFYRVGLILAVLSTLAMGMTQNLGMWVVLRYISGFSSTAGLLLASGLIMNWLIRHQYKSELGLHFTGLGLGIVVSGVAVALMSSHTSWDQQWLYLGMIGLTLLIPAWLWLPHPAQAQMYTATPQAVPPSSRTMMLLIAAYFCAGFGYVVSATFIVAILEKFPVFAGKGSWAWVIVGLAAMPSTFVWDRIETWLGQSAALLLAYGLQIVAIILPALSQDLWVNLFGAMLYGGTFVGIVSLMLSIVGRYFPANPAKAMARLTVSYGIAQILAPVITGYLVTITHSYQSPLFIAAAFMIIGMYLIVLMHRHVHQHNIRTA